MASISHSKAATSLNRKQIRGTTTELMSDGRKLANKLYTRGVRKVNKAQKEALHYTDDLLEQVREHPVKSVLIAGGVGFLISALLNRRL